MEFKGTPGPWAIKHSESNDAWNVIGTKLGAKYKIARFPYIKYEDSTPFESLGAMKSFNEERSLESQYNALLASNAPSLLEALEHCLCIMDQCIVPESMQETYSNAIMNYSQLIEDATTFKEQ